MPFNFHVGLPGPFSYSRRIGGGKRASSPRSSFSEDLATLARLRQEADEMDADRLRVRHAVGWVFACLFAAWMFATVYLIPVGIVALVVTWRGHRARHQRRAAAALDAPTVELPTVPDPVRLHPVGRHAR